MVDRGLLGFRDRVAEHWKEFGQKGKEAVTVQDLLTHRAGLSHFDEGPLNSKLIPTVLPSPSNQLLASRFSEFLARQTPKWGLSPDVSGYHVVTVGFFVGELLQRIDPAKRRLSTIVQEELCTKLNTEFYFGVDTQMPPQRFSRIDLQRSPNDAPRSEHLSDPKSLVSQANMAIFYENPSTFVNRHNEVPSAIGFSSGPGVASIYSILANNGAVNGTQFLKKETVEAMLTKTPKTTDILFMEDAYWTQGGLHYHPEKPSVFWHLGWGGSLGWMDVSVNVSLGYVTNSCRMDVKDEEWRVGPRQTALINAIYKSLSKLHSKL
eukprot:TRINITY_DN4895_c0_g1_i1.p1 TRINITY_DN4895_c0_g1~~TRINITY_DN4895_c0_g1_i1.p1  ORF type:complete len:321 (+),score=69.22 TRINITY_DN4895_c0_g1_i1:338-1300(+)